MATETALRVQILRLRGELSLEDTLRVKHLVGEYLHAGLIHVVLDLTKVTHVHLAGLPVLGERAQKLRQYGGDLKLVGASPYTRHLFDLAGVASNFEWYVDADQAYQRFANAA